MATRRVKRRLAAILAADVAGYSRLMGLDEQRTHLHLKAHFGQLVYSKLNNHGDKSSRIPGDTGGISDCSRRAAVCCRIQLGMIPNDFELHSDHLEF